MNKLYTTNYTLNNSGKLAQETIDRRVRSLLKELVEKQRLDPHDVQRLVKQSLDYQTAMWTARARAKA